MTTQITIQPTLHPDAIKFLLNKDVATEEGLRYQRGEDCGGNDLAKELLAQEDIKTVFFYENAITLTKEENGSWEMLKISSLSIIEKLLPSANIAKKVDTSSALSPELQKIDDIISATIRPSLQMDGGDIELVSLKGNRLNIRYTGACGSCSSSQYGTLDAITNVLKEQYKNDVDVFVVE
jgi:NFU1 iron-sulfur cluster scaffold homolog, mitochondrial